MYKEYVDRLFDKPKKFSAPCDKDGGNYGPRRTPQPSHNNYDEKVKGEEKGKERGRYGGNKMGQESTADPFEKGARGKGQHFMPEGVDAYRFGGCFIVLTASDEP
jgi:hypothetical protein